MARDHWELLVTILELHAMWLNVEVRAHMLYIIPRVLLGLEMVFL